MKICAHTLVQNEEKYLWYSVMSVLPHVDRVMLWVMKSTDKTAHIADLIKRSFPDKVSVKHIQSSDINEFTKVRQDMLHETKEDWVIIVDGDEVWWDEAIISLTESIRKNGANLDSIVSYYTNLIGDIYHFQETAASHYSIDGRTGNLTIRAMSMSVPGLNVSKPHGTQGFFDKYNILIQNRDKKRRLHIDKVAYLHFTHLPRGGTRAADSLVPKREMKYKHELGISFPRDFYYPEVFFRARPNEVASVWQKRNLEYSLKSLPLTWPRKLRRRLTDMPTGY